jgi:hypothetical protein
MTIILKVFRIVSAFLYNPLFLSLFEITLDASIVFTNNSLSGIIIAITDIVAAIWDCLDTLDIISDQSETIWSETL